MERFTISLSDSLAADFDGWIQCRRYSNRSEAVRDLIRKAITTETLRDNQAQYSVATLSYVYNHHERNLAERLTSLQHDAHDLVTSTTHVHLDHDDCLESIFLRGSTSAIMTFADLVTAEPGVRHSMINLIPSQLSSHHHDHHHVHPIN